jgi:hypothetical protein
VADAQNGPVSWTPCPRRRCATRAHLGAAPAQPSSRGRGTR